jgi:hypothetical protein
MGDRRGSVRYEEDSARGCIYPLLLRRLGPASRPGILAKKRRSLNLGTSENSTSTHSVVQGQDEGPGLKHPGPCAANCCYRGRTPPLF